VSNISVVILNYKRPDNLINYIIPNLLLNDIVKNIIISHALPESYFEDFKEISKVVHLKHFEENKKFGVFCRFLAAKLADTNCIIFNDDDYLIKNESINKIFNFWKNDKNTVHGFRGRNIKKNEYIKYDAVQQNVPIVLTQFACVSKKLINIVLDNYKLIDPFVKDCIPIWNGEDIFLSLMAILNSEKLNKIHHLYYYGLAQDHAIHHHEGHYEHRTFILKKILDVFPKLLDLFKKNNYYI